MTDLARRMPANEGEVFLRQSLRYFEPWPDWALRIIVEIWRVYLPTIPRSTIYDFIRFAHDLFLVLKLDGSTPKEAFKCPEIDFVHVGALNGHMAALCENLMLRIKAEFEQNSISSEDYKRYADDLSPERMQTEMLPFLRALPSKLFAFAEGFAQAKSDTFDKKGSLRETMLTKVYVEIFENWPAIEELSGPTALCAFLNPVLKGNITDSEMQLDRVKKICQRMGIRFKPLKKG